ncbi:MAG: flagellar biosynthesis anti-sigma factor FlgM [Pirellulales bacterium]
MQMPSPIGPSSVGITRVHGPHGINAPHAPFRGQSAEGAAATRGASDSLSISSAAEAALTASEAGGIRQDVVSRIKSEIAAGTYETSAKLDAALSRMLDEIG